MPLYLGLDLSTQSLTAVIIDVETVTTLAELSVGFDDRLPQYGTQNGVLPHDEPRVKHSDPVMWADAVDCLFADLREAGVPLPEIRAVSVSGQQHGSVYFNDKAGALLANLQPDSGLAAQIQDGFSRPTAPIWMDSSSTRQCQEITEALGGAEKVAELTGSCCFERFTGPQIRKFWQCNPEAYAATAVIGLVSSYIPSLLVGRHVGIDPGDGSGTNLMNIKTCTWDAAALDATAPDLGKRLLPIIPSGTIVGCIAPYFVTKYGLSASCRVTAGSGDNPNSLVGVGLVSAGKVCISLGTSDTYFGYMPEPNVETSGEGHCFGSPTGGYMSLICFKNGSLARERIRDQFGMDWDGFSKALNATKPGNGGAVMLPYFEPEIVPNVLEPMVYRYGLSKSDAAANVRAVVEAQMMSMATHSRWMDVEPDTIYATGGAAANREILRVMADVHDAVVYQFEVSNSAALGAALRAAHADRAADGSELPWEAVVEPFAKPCADSCIKPDPANVTMYNRLKAVYHACERHALRAGTDPTSLQRAFIRAFK